MDLGILGSATVPMNDTKQVNSYILNLPRMLSLPTKPQVLCKRWPDRAEHVGTVCQRGVASMPISTQEPDGAVGNFQCCWMWNHTGDTSLAVCVRVAPEKINQDPPPEHGGAIPQTGVPDWTERKEKRSQFKCQHWSLFPNRTKRTSCLTFLPPCALAIMD